MNFKPFLTNKVLSSELVGKLVDEGYLSDGDRLRRPSGRTKPSSRRHGPGREPRVWFVHHD